MNKSAFVLMENTSNGSTVLGVFTTDEQAENAVLTYYGQEYTQTSFKRVDDSGLCWVKTLTSKTDVIEVVLLEFTINHI